MSELQVAFTAPALQHYWCPDRGLLERHWKGWGVPMGNTLPVPRLRVSTDGGRFRHLLGSMVVPGKQRTEDFPKGQTQRLTLWFPTEDRGHQLVCPGGLSLLWTGAD